MAFLAGGLAACPVRILHEASVCDNLAALAFAAISGTISLAILEMRVVLLQAALQTRMHVSSNLKISPLLEEDILTN
jgi:hypothetical protein